MSKQGHFETMARNGSRLKEGESHNETEWMEQDEPGVYITLTSLPGGGRDLKRVRFSRKRFNEKQAEQWWAENRARVYGQYNLKDMVERLPVRASQNVKFPVTSFGSSPSNDAGNASVDDLNGQIACQELDTNGINGQLLFNDSSNCSLGTSKQGHFEAMARNGSRSKEGESCNKTEWVEQDEPGVYITITSLPGGGKDLKGVRFSRKRFSEKQAEQWWAENRARVYGQYNVRMVDKSGVGIGSEDLAH